MDILTTQKEAKLLPSDTFPGLKNYQNCFYGRGSAPEPAGRAYSAPPILLSGEGRVAEMAAAPLQLLELNSLMSGISIRYTWTGEGGAILIEIRQQD